MNARIPDSFGSLIAMPHSKTERRTVMKRFVTTATLAAASCAMVLGGAGVATAGGSDGHRGQSQQGSGHHRCGHGGHGGHGGYGHGGFGRGGHGGHGGFGRHGCGHGGGAVAKGFAVGSPGFLSGNNIQVPINIPINVCGNSIDVFIGILNPAFGNVCINR
ncbi:chaplin [Streptomyces sp. NPDC050636]|uniref:chaplin n=1 Tax=Streptomyces sp. NPDC050636 TaxID=3154510 RepID=UPI00341C430B